MPHIQARRAAERCRRAALAAYHAALLREIALLVREPFPTAEVLLIGADPNDPTAEPCVLRAVLGPAPEGDQPPTLYAHGRLPEDWPATWDGQDDGEDPGWRLVRIEDRLTDLSRTGHPDLAGLTGEAGPRPLRLASTTTEHPGGGATLGLARDLHGLNDADDPHDPHDTDDTAGPGRRGVIGDLRQAADGRTVLHAGHTIPDGSGPVVTERVVLTAAERDRLITALLTHQGS